jgi:methyltransferase (TIGR00027 family)
VYRARESERADAVFSDPYARVLAGDAGVRIADSIGDDRMQWSIVARTYAFARMLGAAVAAGADLVLNLAAGLDSRPYRLTLPASLQWIEVDLPEILEYKTEALSNAVPACRLERIGLDLSNHDARRGLFRDVARRCTRAVVFCEGLLIYLMADEVGALARDCADTPPFTRWIVDIVSPGLLAMLNESIGQLVRQAGAPFLFAPAQGPAFFEAYGWQVASVRSLLKTAASLQRLPLFLRVMAMLPESSSHVAGNRPWGGVCLLERTGAAVEAHITGGSVGPE